MFLKDEAACVRKHRAFPMGVPGAGGRQESVRLEDKMDLGHGSFGNQTGDFNFYSECDHCSQALLFVDSADST